MLHRSFLKSLLLVASSTPALAAAPPVELDKVFGARAAVLDISLSPDGKRLLVVVPRPIGGEAVTVIEIDGSAKPKLALTSKGGDEEILNCQWVTDARMLCRVRYMSGSSTSTSAFTRSVAVNSDGSNLRLIGATKAMSAAYQANFGGSIIDLNGGEDGSILLMRQFVPGQISGTLMNNTREGIGVVRVDTATGKEAVVEEPRQTAITFVTDGRGAVRLLAMQPPSGTGYAQNKIVYKYRAAAGGDFQALSEEQINPNGTSSGFGPVAVDPGLDAVYGFAGKDGHTALYKVPLAGAQSKPELVFSKDGVDVDSLVRIGRAQRVVGVSYATDKRHTEFFDPQLARLARSLHQAMPGKSQISFVDASKDESKLVLFVGSDTDPGKYYLFDKATRQMGELLNLRPELAGLTLSEVKPITYKAADGSLIPGYLTLPPGSNGKGLPAIVMPHGGPSSRDEWGFDWLSQYFAQMGFAVIQPNYRGSAGFGTAFLQKNGFQSWKTAIGDIDDAGRWLVSEGIADPNKLAIVGWSYGGYAALQSQVVDPKLYKAVVAIAPVTDLDKWREELANDYRYRQRSDFVGQGPHIEEGSPARHADRFVAPVLLFHGDRDQNVGVAESRLMQTRLKAAGKQVDYVEFAGLDHQLDDSAARSRVLGSTSAFLKKALGL